MNASFSIDAADEEELGAGVTPYANSTATEQSYAAGTNQPPAGHYTREALHQGTHVCPPPCAQMAGHKAILWQPHLVDRARGPVPFKESLRRLASLSGS